MKLLNSCLDFQNHILNKVSRSFALTIPLLPRSLEVAITNGYLLCRIADTIEDDPNITVHQKSKFHYKFIDLLVYYNKNKINQFIAELYPLLSSYSSLFEQLLILNIDKVLFITSTLPVKTQHILKQCVTTMNKGMMKFEAIITKKNINTLKELEEYCYIVAGVVGEMLTKLFCQHLKLSNKYQKVLMPLARSFGQALQITNILKDQLADKTRDICYLPSNFSIKKIININLEHFNNAITYILLIPKQQSGIRKFCLWAITMAIIIIKNINNNPHFTNVNQIKISRFKLKQIIIIANIINKSNTLLKFWFKITTARL